MAKSLGVAKHDLIVRLYRDGLSGPEISDRLGVSITTVYRYIGRAGIKPSKLVEDKKRKGQGKFHPEVEAEIAERYGNGECSPALAKEFGCHTKTITNIVKRNGVDVRKPGGTEKTVGDEDVDRMVELYSGGISQEKIGDEIGVSQPIVSRYLRSAGVETGRRTGEDHPNWNGGRIDQNGYAYVLVRTDDPYYQMAQSSGYVAEHRLIMAEYLERPLMSHETVHHINGKKKDNRLENLQLRIGKHGKGVVYTCSDCGSHRVTPKELC